MDRLSSDHDDLYDDLPLLVLDALDPVEAEDIEQHVRDCPVCRAELARLRAAGDLLALAAPQLDPPPDLRERLLARLDAPASAADRAPRSLRDRLPGWAYPVLAAAAVIVLVLAGTLALLYRDLSRTRDDLSASQRQLATQMAVLADPARTVSLVADAGALVESDGYGGQTYGMLYLSSDQTRAVMVVEHLPPAPAGQVYQVWLVQNQQRVSAGVFQVDSTGTAQFMISAPQAIASYQSLGITAEPGPDGSATPTGQRLVSCRLA